MNYAQIITFILAVLLATVYVIISFRKTTKDRLYYYVYGTSFFIMTVVGLLTTYPKESLVYLLIGIIVFFVASQILRVKSEVFRQRYQDAMYFRIKPKWIDIIARIFYPVLMASFIQIMSNYAVVYPLLLVLFERLTYPIYLRHKEESH